MSRDTLPWACPDCKTRQRAKLCGMGTPARANRRGVRFDALAGTYEAFRRPAIEAFPFRMERRRTSPCQPATAAAVRGRRFSRLRPAGRSRVRDPDHHAAAGRLVLGEAMQRIGQPAVMGHLLAGNSSWPFRPCWRLAGTPSAWFVVPRRCLRPLGSCSVGAPAT
jgi:hypothetical protein